MDAVCLGKGKSCRRIRCINGSRIVRSSSSNLFLCRGLIVLLPMLDVKSMLCPTIIYRPIRPSDLDVLEQIHAALFPVRYEREFFLSVVTAQGIISWAAVDVSRSDGRSDELIGFVTARVIKAKDSEDLLRYDGPRKDQTLVYILTLGVVEHYRNLGIASSLVREVTNYASSVTNCTAVYLHVIACNHAAICFYKKMLFKLVRRLPKFYYINGHHYDSYMFVYYVNGGQSPCSSLQVVSTIATYLRGIYKSLYAKIWNNEKQLARWSRCKETNSLLVTNNMRIVGSDSSLC